MVSNEDELRTMLDHQHQMITILRRRLREREIQEIKFGIIIPPEITSDIHELNERITKSEAEIQRLQRLLAEDDKSATEVEYRAILAEVIEHYNSKLTVRVNARLDWARLRLGLTSEQAQKLEEEYRFALVEEEFTRSQYADNLPIYLSAFLTRLNEMSESEQFTIENTIYKYSSMLHWISLYSPTMAMRLHRQAVPQALNPAFQQIITQNDGYDTYLGGELFLALIKED